MDLAAVIGPTGQVIGADFCEPMIRNGLSKTARAAAPITMMVANAEALPYPSEAFDVATVGFGVRNVANLSKAVSEMARVVKPGGRVVILEFNRPENRWYKPLVDFYLFHVLPRLGGLFQPPRSVHLSAGVHEVFRIASGTGANHDGSGAAATLRNP